MFEPYQLVVHDVGYDYSPGHHPFINGAVFLFLSEIKQMPGHCAIVDEDGKVWWGQHTSNFREPTEDEI